MWSIWAPVQPLKCIFYLYNSTILYFLSFWTPCMISNESIIMHLVIIFSNEEQHWYLAYVGNTYLFYNSLYELKKHVKHQVNSKLLVIQVVNFNLYFLKFLFGLTKTRILANCNICSLIQSNENILFLSEAAVIFYITFLWGLLLIFRVYLERAYSAFLVQNGA